MTFEKPSAMESPEDAPRKYLLVVRGPFLIVDESGKKPSWIDADVAKRFWKSNSQLDEIREKHGCYVFAVKAAKGFTPWYVGQTQFGMYQEIFAPHKLVNYNWVICNGIKGTPALFFIVAEPAGKKKLPAKIVDELESDLIQAGMFANKNLLNKKLTNPPSWGIKGVIRSGKGKPPREASIFRKLMSM